MAIHVFSIPAMRAEPEWVFSLAGAMRSPRKNRLNAESIQVCQCLRSWHIAGIIDDLFATVGDRKRPDTGEDVEEAQVFDRAPGRHGGGGGGVRLSRMERA